MLTKTFLVSVALTSALWPFAAGAQGMMGGINNADDHTAREEAEGKAIWGKMRDKTLDCGGLSEQNFAALGEYFMGQMMGNGHEAMNAMMARMMGDQAEEQIHVVMGKRLSGCDAAAQWPASAIGFMPMMQMMWGGWSSPFGVVGGSGFNGGMMNFTGSRPALWIGWILMILWWSLVIIALWALAKWLTSSFRAGSGSALDTLKQRYAKGEISKKQFEEMKKDLSL